MDLELIGTAAGFVFTLFIFSYLLGDNILFRLAVYVFVGLAAAFTTIVTLESVILPLLDETGEIFIVLASLIITGLLLARPLVRLTPISNLGVGFLVAVGAAVTVVGAITGTLIPLTVATGTGIEGETIRTGTDALNNPMVNGVVMVVGVVTTLFYFQYLAKQREDGSVQRGALSRVLGGVGEWFVALTLGAVYGAAILTSLTILTERISYFTSTLGI